MTASKSVVRIISGLGHSRSYDTIVQLETAIALKQAADLTFSLAPGFVEGRLAMLVYDNIDFNEETLTGRGTTRHTNSVMIQNRYDLPVDVSRQSPMSKTKRTLALPPVEIQPYFLTAKAGPSVSCDISEDSDCLRLP